MDKLRDDWTDGLMDGLSDRAYKNELNDVLITGQVERWLD